MRKGNQRSDDIGLIMSKLREPMNELIDGAEEELKARAYLPEEKEQSVRQRLLLIVGFSQLI